MASTFLKLSTCLILVQLSNGIDLSQWPIFNEFFKDDKKHEGSLHFKPHHSVQVKDKQPGLSHTSHSVQVDLQGKAGGLADSPPMGWFSGQRFGCNTDCDNYPDDCLSETLVKTTADAMAKNRMKDAGYRYVSLGDCWLNKTRDSQGKLIPDPKRFPSGMKSLADYVHSKGLLFGLFLDLGNASCNGYPGSQSHLQEDAQTMADWGVDMMTLDLCYSQNSQTLDKVFPQMVNYFNQTGRKILVSCDWPVHIIKLGAQPNYDLVAKTCHMYKTYPDIRDDWVDMLDLIKHYADAARPLVNYTGAGRQSWNEFSQVLVGDYGLSDDQLQLHMGLMAVLASPLMVSADVRNLNDYARDLLLNQNLLRINQDTGTMGLQSRFDGQTRYWLRPLTTPKGSFALALTYENISGGPVKVSIKLQDLGFTTASAYNFTDVFSGQKMGIYKPWYTLNCEVNPTGIKLFLAEALTLNDLKEL